MLISFLTFENVKMTPYSLFTLQILTVSRKSQYKDDCRGTIEIPQRARIFKANCCLKIHNVHLNRASQISG